VFPGFFPIGLLGGSVSQGHFALEATGDRPVVRVIGDVDFSNRGEFEDVLSRTESSDALVVSFLECSFCDSSIIGALMKLRNARPNADITLLVSPKSAVARVFELVGVDRVFPIGSGGEPVSATA
jgi:anti-anti-sigma factor